MTSVRAKALGIDRDLASGILLLVVAVAYYAVTVRIPISTLSDEVGPQGLPTILAVLLAVLGAALALRGAFKRRAVQTGTGSSDDEEGTLPRALGFLGIGAGYILIAPVLGYVPAVALLIAAIAVYEGVRPSWRVGAVALAGAVGFWLTFVKLLGVVQPTSFLLD